MRRSYFGDAAADALLARARAIFDADEWSEDDPLPATLSISGTIRAVASIGGEASLGLSEKGNLTATWQGENKSLNVEGTPDGKLSWAYVVEGPDNFELLGNEGGSLTEVLQAIAG